MSVSKYLPPFTRAERGSGVTQRTGATTQETTGTTETTVVERSEPGVARSGAEVTYADFLGDEVPETETIGG